jgi:hypothetical protein
MNMRRKYLAGAIAGALLIAGSTTAAIAQPPPPPPPAGSSTVALVNVVRHYDTSDPRFSTTTFFGHFTEDLACPSGHALNGGVRITNPDPSAPPDAYPGSAQQVYGDQWTISGENGRFVGQPRPVNNDTAWRIPVAVSLAYTQNPATPYPIDVTYFVVCG